MSKVGEVRLVVSREEDGFHFYVSNRLEWTDWRVVEVKGANHPSLTLRRR
jgi:hypothetical protein